MARLVVLTTEGLADGFRLAGCATIVALPGAPASTALREAVVRDDIGVLLVTADLWASVGERLRGSLEQLATPVVAPLPAGVVPDGTTRGQLLGEMLRRAIGFRIELPAGERR